MTISCVLYNTALKISLLLWSHLSLIMKLAYLNMFWRIVYVDK